MNLNPGAHPACWVAAIQYAAGEVDKLAAHLVGNVQVSGARDYAIYEQGIGCEIAGKMLREVAILIERQNRSTNETEMNLTDEQLKELKSALADKKSATGVRQIEDADSRLQDLLLAYGPELIHDAEQYPCWLANAKAFEKDRQELDAEVRRLRVLLDRVGNAVLEQDERWGLYGDESKTAREAFKEYKANKNPK